ncbi:TetR/AcrR family transcriptional regulator [Sphingopyxis sp. BSNA05]|uniref:TetR/AcrR family transcriptional regulator n=1 Tax=Sphingopyxis sp. BSNA05 TaxID=1236614 RepID=UPI00349F7AA8
MSDLATAVGMSPSNLYRFFENKDALAEAWRENGSPNCWRSWRNWFPPTCRWKRSSTSFSPDASSSNGRVTRKILNFSNPIWNSATSISK